MWTLVPAYYGMLVWLFAAFLIEFFDWTQSLAVHWLILSFIPVGLVVMYIKDYDNNNS